MRRGRGLPAALLLATLAPAAQAAPVFIASPPVIEREAGEMVLLVGGFSDDGRTLKPSTIEIEIDGEPGPSAKATEAYSQYAQAASEASSSWSSPLAVGIVYLWVKDNAGETGDAITTGVVAFLRRLPTPARTQVYVTLYGRKRQAITKTDAYALAGGLDGTLPYLPGDRPNLAEAIRDGLKTLLGDESPLKVLLVVTDGRDFNDSTGDSSADFMTVADDVQKAGVKLMLVSFPPPAADAEQSAKNLADLGTSAAFRRATEQSIEMQTTLESLGQSIADMRRVRIELPWSWRNLGGTHKVRLNITADGKRRAIEVGKVEVQASVSWLLIPIGILVALLGAAAVVVVILRRRKPADDRGDEDDVQAALLAAANSMIQRGLSAQRALVELTRSFPNDVSSLAELDESVFTDERYPAIRTRAGRRRFEELQALLSSKVSDESLLGGDLLDVLTQSMSAQAAPDQVASSIAARVPEDQWAAFSRMRLDELARALRASGGVLATPHARSVALEIQAALRHESRDRASNAMTVGWLVRAAGQGKRGETLRLPSGRAVLGRGSECQVRMDADAQIAGQHAAIVERRGGFTIEPMEGAIKVETKPVSGRAPLGDGDTIEIGQSRYVFKCVSSGNVGQSRPPAG